MRTPLEEKAHGTLVAFAAGATLLCASLANLLAHNDYPFLRPENGLITAAALIIAMVMAPFYQAQRRWGRAVMEGLLAAIFLDLNTSSLTLALIVGVLIAALTAWRKISLIGPMAIIGTVALVTTLLGIGQNPWIKTAEAAVADETWVPQSDKPAVVHLILDEHIGIEGIPSDHAAKQGLQDELRSFYLESGFAVYGGAYSEFLHTVNAVPHILNLGRGLGQIASRKGATTGQTEYLKTLNQSGYRPTIIQSNFADLCGGNAFRECITYQASSLNPTLGVPLSTLDRSKLITLRLLALSGLAVNSVKTWNKFAGRVNRRGEKLPKFHIKDDNRSSTVGALAAFDGLIERLRKVHPGDAYVAHLLVPHYPYVTKADCSFLPRSEWKVRRSDVSMIQRQSAYFEQVRCTKRKVRLALNAISASPAGSNAVVIIHGDHGSRITRRDPNEKNIGRFADSDVVAGFSTLFAVRAPEIEPEYRAEPQPVAALLRDLTEAGFRAAPRIDPSRVNGVRLDDTDWKPGTRIPLPPLR